MSLTMGFWDGLSAKRRMGGFFIFKVHFFGTLICNPKLITDQNDRKSDIENRKSNFWDTICNPKLITDQNNRKSDIENRISEIKKLLVVRGLWWEECVQINRGNSGPIGT